MLVAALGPASAQAAPPSNDNFADAQVVGPALPVAVPATTVESTAEPGEPPHFSTNPARHTVWYSWTPAANTQAVIDVCDRDPSIGPISTTEAVYTGSALNALTPVASTAGDCVFRFAATGGQNYKIAIDTGFDVGAFTFRLRQPAPPANDAFANAEAIGPSLPITISRSNVDATIEPNEPVINGADGRSVWFKWTAPASMSVRLDTCDFQTRSGAGNQALSIFTGSTLTTLVPVFSNAFQCRTTFNAVSGTTYRISFSGNFGGEGTFTLKMLQPAPPANDDFSAAIPVGPGLPVALPGNNVFATVQTGEPNHGEYPGDTIFPPHDSVWYSWTPTANVQARIRVCNSNFGARLGVYTGNAVNALTKVAPAVPNRFPALLLDPLQRGDGHDLSDRRGRVLEDTEGNFNLDIHVFAPPGNDDFANAQQLPSALPIAVSGTTIDAGAQSGEPNHTGGDLGPGNSVWYRWTPAASEPVSIETCGSDFSALVGVHTGTALNDLSLAGTSEGGPGCGGTLGGKLTLSAVAGTTYFIAVDGFDEGHLTLAIRSLTQPPAVPASGSGFNLAAALKKCHKLKSRDKRHKCVKKARKRAMREGQTG